MSLQNLKFNHDLESSRPRRKDPATVQIQFLSFVKLPRSKTAGAILPINYTPSPRTNECKTMTNGQDAIRRRTITTQIPAAISRQYHDIDPSTLRKNYKRSFSHLTSHRAFQQSQDSRMPNSMEIFLTRASADNRRNVFYFLLRSGAQYSLLSFIVLNLLHSLPAPAPLPSMYLS